MHHEPTAPAEPTEAKVDIPSRMLTAALQAMWRAMNEDARIGVKLLDSEGRVIALNACAAKLLNISHRAATGKKIADLYPPVHRPMVAREIDAIVNHGRMVCGDGPVCHSTYLLWGYRRESSTRLLCAGDAHGMVEPTNGFTPGHDPSEVLGILRTCKIADDPVNPSEIIGLVQGSNDRDALLGELVVLSDRELEVAMLIATGMTDAEIAELLCRSLRTVHAHRRSIGAKLRDQFGVKSRSDLAREMAQRGLIAAVPAKRERSAPAD
ncbi:MAG: LuxR C-terminal-related transcriptional regulator [Phycisphaerales bacterium JB064]